MEKIYLVIIQKINTYMNENFLNFIKKYMFSFSIDMSQCEFGEILL